MGELTDINEKFQNQSRDDMLTGLRNVIAEVKAGNVKHLILISVAKDLTYSIRTQGGCTGLEDMGLMAQVFFSAMARPTTSDFDEDDPGDGNDEG